MSAINEAAMWMDGNVMNRKQHRILRKHLRKQFGKKSFVSERAFEMLGEGHTEVFTAEVPYDKGDGERPEILKVMQKNMANELIAQLSRFMISKDFTFADIEQIDVMAGGDHGQGAFQVGAKVVIVLKNADEPGTRFEIWVAEVICKKDNSEVIRKCCVSQSWKN
jgi:hypothetical protein